MRQTKYSRHLFTIHHLPFTKRLYVGPRGCQAGDSLRWGVVEMRRKAVLDSTPLSISTRGRCFNTDSVPSHKTYASTHTRRRQGHTSQAADRVHAEARRPHLQPPVPALPD